MADTGRRIVTESVAWLSTSSRDIRKPMARERHASYQTLTLLVKDG